MTDRPSLHDLEAHDAFVARHLGPQDDDRAGMLASIGLQSLDDLVDAVVPASIRIDKPLDLGTPVTETCRRSTI